MKKTILYLLFLLISTIPAYSIKLTPSKSVDSTSVENSATVQRQFTAKDIQAITGKKLTLKERIGLLLFKRPIREHDYTDRERSKANTNATLGLVFGILSIIAFPLFAIPGLILSNSAIRAERESPGILGGNKGLARAGQITSWVGIALLALFVAIVFLLIATGGFQ